jgi:hypothetical protein
MPNCGKDKFIDGKVLHVFLCEDVRIKDLSPGI